LSSLAAIEAAQAILQCLIPTASVTENSALSIPALSSAVLEVLEEATQSVPRQKLD